MGTIGINFGSASSGQGFDVASTVTAIQGIEQAIETPWKSQLSTLTAQDTALTQIGSDLSTLTTSLQSLTDFSGALSQKQGSSSNTDLLALTGASSAALAGSHTIFITSLAQTSSNYSDSVTNAADTLAGSISIKVGSGPSQTVTIDSSSNTLATLASAINSAGIGVNASVVTDTSGSSLSLVSTTAGAAGQLVISSAVVDSSKSNTPIGFSVGQSGKNAVLTVDGLSVSSASNTVTNAVPGVTLQLLAPSPTGSQIQVQITNDTSAASTAVISLVSAYNAVVRDIKAQEGNDATGNAEPLFGSSALTAIQTQLNSALLGGTASGSIKTISDLGISFNNDGTLALNTDTLQGVLNSNYTDVVGFLQNSGSFGQNFGATLNNLGTQAPGGAIYLAQQQNSQQEAALNQNVANEEARLATEKISLTNELNTANEILQSIPSQLNQVNELYSAITGYNTGTH